MPSFEAFANRKAFRLTSRRLQEVVKPCSGPRYQFRLLERASNSRSKSREGWKTSRGILGREGDEGGGSGGGEARGDVCPVRHWVVIAEYMGCVLGGLSSRWKGTLGVRSCCHGGLRSRVVDIGLIHPGTCIKSCSGLATFVYINSCCRDHLITISIMTVVAHMISVCRLSRELGT